jgi:hypothetical protein
MEKWGWPLIAFSVIILGLSASVVNDLINKKQVGPKGERAGAGEEAGRGSTGYDADSERSSIISNISEGDPYSIHSGGGSRRHRKSNKGSKGIKASKGSKGRKSRKHNNKKSKSKNSKSF